MRDLNTKPDGTELAECADSLHDEYVVSLSGVKAALPARYKHAARQVLLRCAGLTSAGSGVRCPCCGGSFRKFARFHRESDQCPGCEALMRHRAIVLYLQNVWQVAQNGGDLLQVAPAPGVRAWLLSRPSLRCVSIDIEPGVADIQGDVTALPFEESSFDLALCIHVLEHVADDGAAIRELFRVLKPGGKALIQVPPSSLEVTLEDPSVTSPKERERLFGQYDHVRLCGADYERRLASPGFAVERVDYVEQVGPTAQATFGLRVGEPFYVCAKPHPSA
jgi:SAM-dependent methyltransferase